eukprot:scaffold46108_cov21-Tisochrysis_lutea.AAC.1
MLASAPHWERVWVNRGWMGGPACPCSVTSGVDCGMVAALTARKIGWILVYAPHCKKRSWVNHGWMGGPVCPCSVTGGVDCGMKGGVHRGMLMVHPWHDCGWVGCIVACALLCPLHWGHSGGIGANPSVAVLPFHGRAPDQTCLKGLPSFLGEPPVHGPPALMLGAPECWALRMGTLHGMAGVESQSLMSPC